MGDADGLEMVHRLRALTVELDLAGAAFAQQHGFHPTDLRALICLLDAERSGDVATPGWLGRHLRLNSASVTALTDRLERAGHVRREQDPGDRRRVILSVTPAAVELGWAFFGPLIGQFVAVIDNFDDAELATIGRFLDELQAAVASTPPDEASPDTSATYR